MQCVHQAHASRCTSLSANFHVQTLLSHFQTCTRTVVFVAYGATDINVAAAHTGGLRGRSFTHFPGCRPACSHTTAVPDRGLHESRDKLPVLVYQPAPAGNAFSLSYLPSHSHPASLSHLSSHSHSHSHSASLSHVPSHSVSLSHVPSHSHSVSLS